MNDEINVIVPDYVEDSVNVVDSSENTIDENISNEPIDYTDILTSLDVRLSNIESLQLNDSQVYLDQVNEIRDNTYRLYYFLGGLYIALAIIIGIKFFKIFF